MKRLRKRFGPVRFLMAGEYGERRWRPHYHALLFGLRLPDLVPVSAFGSQYSTSRILESLWQLGGCSVGPVNMATASYVSQYILKKVNGDAAENHYSRVDGDGCVFRLEPEYCAMSRRPGIASAWLDRFYSDVFPRGKVVVQGVEAEPPRFYKRRFKDADPFAYKALQDRLAADGFLRRSDGTDARLTVRNLVAVARANSRKRSL